MPRGFDHDDFEIDAQAATMTCPAGITVALTAKGRATFGANCRACPLPAVAPRHEAAARSCSIPITTISPPVGPRPDRGVRTPSLLALAAHGRAHVGVAHPRDDRKLRYRGVERNQLWWSHRCAAVNLQRLITLGLVAGNDGGWAIA